MCVCVCVCEREREKERNERDQERGLSVGEEREEGAMEGNGWKRRNVETQVLQGRTTPYCSFTL